MTHLSPTKTQFKWIKTQCLLKYDRWSTRRSKWLSARTRVKEQFTYSVYCIWWPVFYSSIVWYSDSVTGETLQVELPGTSSVLFLEHLQKGDIHGNPTSLWITSHSGFYFCEGVTVQFWGPCDSLMTLTYYAGCGQPPRGEHNVLHGLSKSWTKKLDQTRGSGFRERPND